MTLCWILFFCLYHFLSLSPPLIKKVCSRMNAYLKIATRKDVVMINEKATLVVLVGSNDPKW